MSIFSSLRRAYCLRRHRLGIGVHSPFAYRVVSDVIYGKGYYYSVLNFRRLTMGFPKRLKREYELIFRLIARLAPEGVRLAGSVEPQIELLVRMADMRPMMARGMGGYTNSHRVLTICESADLMNGLPENILKSGNILIVRRLKDAPQVASLVEETIKGGWIFGDNKMMIVVSNSDEPLNIIDVKMT